MKNKFDVLFKDLCCSRCKSDFTKESITILRQENSMLVVNLSCQICGKNFGVCFLGTKNIDTEYFNQEKTPLKIIEDLPAISSDDVLDAHKFLKNLDEHWTKYLPE